MKPVKNLTRMIVYTENPHMDHRAVCSGDRHCNVCGRRMCVRCTTKEHRPDVCLICSGSYYANEISLFNTA